MLNDYEIRVFGMQRSGHHAVTNWIIGHFVEPVCFINDITHTKKLIKNGSIFFYNMNQEQIKKELAKKYIPKKCLIYNVEETNFLRGLKDGRTLRNIPRGKSKEVYNILVLRDPYNLFASRLRIAENEAKRGRRLENRRKRWLGKRAQDLWKEHAEEFLGIKKTFQKNFIAVNYNQWFLDITYRKELSKKLGLKFSDKNINQVPNFGGGSSFSKRGMHGKGAKMKVLDRWKQYRFDNFYNNSLSDEELIGLSKKIFGNIK